eukprot:m.150563 g.150563  ORF g.150563 m.150563 type:complete len:280 (-) comp16180_c1_seq4:103-942(-)
MEDTPRPALYLPRSKMQRLHQSIDYSLPPQTAEEYILHVRRATAQLPDVIVAAEIIHTHTESTTLLDNASESQSGQPIQRQITTLPRRVTNSIQVHADPDWEDDVLTTFGQLQQHVFAYREALKEGLIKLTPSQADIILPRADDSKGWRALCFGTQATDDDDTCSTSSLSPLPQPGLAVLARLSLMQSTALLSCLTQWLKPSPTHHIMTWTYSVLAAMDADLLDSTAHGCIRDLCRTCFDLYGSGPQVEHIAGSSAAGLCLLLTIAVVHFRQLDFEPLL